MAEPFSQGAALKRAALTGDVSQLNSLLADGYDVNAATNEVRHSVPPLSFGRGRTLARFPAPGHERPRPPPLPRTTCPPLLLPPVTHQRRPGTRAWRMRARAAGAKTAKLTCALRAGGMVRVALVRVPQGTPFPRGRASGGLRPAGHGCCQCAEAIGPTPTAPLSPPPRPPLARQHGPALGSKGRECACGGAAVHGGRQAERHKRRRGDAAALGGHVTRGSRGVRLAGLEPRSGRRCQKPL